MRSSHMTMRLFPLLVAMVLVAGCGSDDGPASAPKAHRPKDGRAAIRELVLGPQDDPTDLGNVDVGDTTVAPLAAGISILPLGDTAHEAKVAAAAITRRLDVPVHVLAAAPVPKAFVEPAPHENQLDGDALGAYLQSHYGVRGHDDVTLLAITRLDMRWDKHPNDEFVYSLWNEVPHFSLVSTARLAFTKDYGAASPELRDRRLDALTTRQVAETYLRVDRVKAQQLDPLGHNLVKLLPSVLEFETLHTNLCVLKAAIPPAMRNRLLCDFA